MGTDVTHAFGDESELVSEFASAAIAGLQGANMSAYALYQHRVPPLPPQVRMAVVT